MTEIRNAEASDAAELASIYRYYVEETAISFEYTAPDECEMERRIEETRSKGYPYLVLEDDGMIRGYAYAHPFSGRKAYYRSVEVTIYLRHGDEHKGYGKLD